MDRRFLFNLGANFISLCISMVISLWLVPFMINSLGAGAYGFVPLTQQIVFYMATITMALNSMAGRFFTVSMKSGDIDGAEEYFNTSLYSAIILSIILIIPIGLLAIYIDRVLNVPPELLDDVRMAIIAYGAVAPLSTLNSCFTVSTFYTNRLDVRSGLDTLNVAVRSLFIVLLFMMFKPKIWYVSLSNLISCIIYSIACVAVFKWLLPGMGIRPFKYNLKKLKEMLYSGLWISFTQVGNILFLQIDLLVANWTLGAVGAGEYAALLQWSNLLRVFSGCITTVFGPTITILYAQRNIEGLVSYSKSAVKLTGYLMALPIGLICGMGGSLLKLWLNPGFVRYQWLLMLMTLHLSINLAAEALFSVQTAVNRVVVPAVVTLSMGVGNLLLAVALSGPLGLGPYGIALAGAIMLTLRNFVFTPIYSAHITGQHCFKYSGSFIKPMIAVALTVGTGQALQHYFTIDSWGRFVGGAFIISVVYLAFVYFVLMSGEERRQVKSLAGNAGAFFKGKKALMNVQSQESFHGQANKIN